MKLRITGNLRTVADSAWVSTLDEVKAKARTDEDAKRVVNYLVENQHTSPLESVTLTFESLSKKSGEQFEECQILRYYEENKYARSKEHDGPYSLLVSIDLLNFLKTTFKQGLFKELPWKLFQEQEPELAEIVRKFKPLGGQTLTPEASEILGATGMNVELINFHQESELFLSRATWRIKAPLAIATQILRHRSGSFNQTSGKYKTLNQEVIGPVKDCSDIFQKIGIDLNRYLAATDGINLQYKQAMKKANDAKKENKISAKEYARLREFARFILPEGRLTEIYMTFYLDDFYNNYVVLRDDEGAQVEHMWIAQEAKKTLEAEIEKRKM